jgi:hypothetical protein
MRIFEGEGRLEDRNDVTFTYDANFFLFTTLEIARPIAHGRMQAPAPQVPVLTGMPVSGMAYLDRPGLAGYFIFPDLSVRHEGTYRLSFSLYEETKNPGDADPEPSNEAKRPSIPGAATPNASFDWRLDIKSQEFIVYSAKKFPGLTESTLLSKTVAEQGCRVRIRRDIRMRRREGKATNEYDAAAEEQYARAGRTPSVQDYRERSRSLSNESMNRHAYPEMERRMSGEYQRPYPYPGSRPQGHLAFGASAGNQYQAPPPRFAQPPAPAAYQPAPAPHPHPAQYRQPPPPHQDAFNRPPQPLAAPPSNQPLPPRDPYESRSQAQPTAESPSHNRPWQSGSEFSTSDSMPAMGIKLPPIKNFTIKALKQEASQPLMPFGHVASQRERTEANHPFTDRVLPPLVAAQAAPSTKSAAPAAPTGKRTHQAAFDPEEVAEDQPLYNGMRPVAPRKSDSGGEEDEDGSPATPMVYKRADGTFYKIKPEVQLPF